MSHKESIHHEVKGVREEIINEDKIVYTLNEINNENEEIVRPGTPRALLVEEENKSDEAEEYEICSNYLRDSEADEWAFDEDNMDSVVEIND